MVNCYADFFNKTPLKLIRYICISSGHTLVENTVEIALSSFSPFLSKANVTTPTTTDALNLLAF